jgi:hypothetical protein
LTVDNIHTLVGAATDLHRRDFEMSERSTDRVDGASASNVLRIEIAPAQSLNKDDNRDSQRLDSARLVHDYLRVSAWPMFAAVLLLAYRPPLGEMVASLARKLDAADKVSLGSFSLEVAAQAREVGSPALAESIGELSRKAVEELMRIPRRGSMILASTMSGRPLLEYGLPDSVRLSALQDLTEKGFIRFREDLPEYLRYVRSAAQRADNHPTDGDHIWYVISDSTRVDTARIRQQGYELTDAGRRAVEAITRAVASQLSRSH